MAVDVVPYLFSDDNPVPGLALTLFERGTATPADYSDLLLPYLNNFSVENTLTSSKTEKKTHTASIAFQYNASAVRADPAAKAPPHVILAQFTDSNNFVMSLRMAYQVPDANFSVRMCRAQKFKRELKVDTGRAIDCESGSVTETGTCAEQKTFTLYKWEIADHTAHGYLQNGGEIFTGRLADPAMRADEDGNIILNYTIAFTDSRSPFTSTGIEKSGGASCADFPAVYFCNMKAKEKDAIKTVYDTKFFNGFNFQTNPWRRADEKEAFKKSYYGYLLFVLINNGLIGCDVDIPEQLQPLDKRPYYWLLIKSFSGTKNEYTTAIQVDDLLDLNKSDAARWKLKTFPPDILEALASVRIGMADSSATDTLSRVNFFLGKLGMQIDKFSAMENMNFFIKGNKLTIGDPESAVNTGVRTDTGVTAKKEEDKKIGATTEIYKVSCNRMNFTRDGFSFYGISPSDTPSTLIKPPSPGADWEAALDSESKTITRECVYLAYGQEVLTAEYKQGMQIRGTSGGSGMTVSVTQGSETMTYEIDQKAIDAYFNNYYADGKENILQHVSDYAQRDPIEFIARFTKVSGDSKQPRVAFADGSTSVTMVFGLRRPMPGIKPGFFVFFDIADRDFESESELPSFARGVYRVDKISTKGGSGGSIATQQLHCVR